MGVCSCRAIRARNTLQNLKTIKSGMHTKVVKCSGTLNHASLSKQEDWRLGGSGGPTTSKTCCRQQHLCRLLQESHRILLDVRHLALRQAAAAACSNFEPSTATAPPLKYAVLLSFKNATLHDISVPSSMGIVEFLGQ
jgi:hypothetical protein